MTMWRMRTVWLTGITALLLGPVGCVMEHADDSAFQLSWSLAYEGSNAAGVSCDDAGTPTVTVTAQHLTTNNVYTAQFPCSAMQAVTDVLPLGSYKLTVTLSDAKGRPVYTLEDAPEQIGRRGLTAVEEIPFLVQSWDLYWYIKRVAANGAETLLNCADVGGKTVELITQLPGEDKERFQFDCAQGRGETQAIRNGLYGTQVRLLNAAGQSLYDTQVMPFEVAPGTRAKLPPVPFDLP